MGTGDREPSESTHCVEVTLPERYPRLGYIPVALAHPNDPLLWRDRGRLRTAQASAKLKP